MAALGKIYALDVRLAGIAALHPNIGKLARRVYRKLLIIFFAAIRTGDAAEVPFGKPERAQERSDRSVSLCAQDARAARSLPTSNKPGHALCISVDRNRRATAARREGPYSCAIKRNGSESSMSRSAFKGSENPPTGARSRCRERLS